MSDESKKGLRCSFCGKHESQVHRMIQGPGVRICDECVQLCMSILNDGFDDVSSSALEETSSNPSFRMLMHSWTHSSQMRTPGPWIIRWTWLSCLPQKEHRRPFLLSSLMVLPQFWNLVLISCW